MERHSRIMVVDDNATNVAILEELLGEEYFLKTAMSGEEALEVARDFRPSVILLDIMMPGLNGYETCRKMRENLALSYTKIIMVSAKAMIAERLKGYEAGADDYITKPFDHDELLVKVRVYMKLKSMEEVNHLNSKLLSFLTHETQTPLTGLMDAAGNLMLDEAADPEHRKMWGMIHQKAAGFQSLCEQVITLSSMKCGMFQPQFETTDVSAVVGNAVSAVANEASGRNVQIEQELCDVTAVLDRQQITNMVDALLANAIRYSPANGRVVVGVSNDGESLCLTVRAEGEGINPELLPHVFEEFADANVGKLVYEGLSLAIAQEVVLAHDGTIGVESTPGSGATFTVRLPLAA